jgi:hypothetical protein
VKRWNWRRGQWRCFGLNLDLRVAQRKIFWTTLTLLSLIADFALPLRWALGAMIPICVASWWFAYRSEWF